MRILVVADDITGAAEIAGIARRMGCRVRFTTSPDRLDGVEEVAVLATDTRSMCREEAIKTTRAIVEQLDPLPKGVTLFKKTDSALRGHLVAELQELMQLGYNRALLLAANPSKGRCIERGIYTIGGTPIAETLFRTDPEFPATTSEAVALVGGGVHYANTSEQLPAKGITIGESRTVADVEAWVARLDDATLLAGAADAFQALLRREGFRETAHTPFDGLGGRRTLIALGSTVRHDLSQEPFFRRNRVAQCPMPDSVFAGGEVAVWIAAAEALLTTHNQLLLRIPQQVEVDGGRALNLRRAMAECTAAIVRQMQPEEWIIEGGASAYAMLEEIGWHDFTVANEVAAGVVRLYHAESNTYLTFKPGSYAWGGMFR